MIDTLPTLKKRNRQVLGLEDFTETDLQAIRAAEPPPDATETAIQQKPPGNGYCLGLVRFRRNPASVLSVCANSPRHPRAVVHVEWGFPP